MPPVAFAAVTGLTPDGPDRFAVDVHPEWTIAGKPNGGYLLGVLGRAAVAVGPHEHPIAASAHFLRSPVPGPAAVNAELLRGGRSASQLRVQLRQHDQLCIEALVTTSVLDPEAKPYWGDGAPAAGTPSFEDSIRLPSVNPLGLKVAIMDQVDLRIEPDSF